MCFIAMNLTAFKLLIARKAANIGGFFLYFRVLKYF